MNIESIKRFLRLVIQIWSIAFLLFEQILHLRHLVLVKEVKNIINRVLNVYRSLR